ncbi:cysteine-rich tail protein 1 [Suncus etruscus]|uniref:cysteine-rich tail protein 1 n=1 Tax=Suncus etruscus TaxID=109475 RepID=UPI0021100D39|nr:cysteine-rich tail protein 1 [Suncus etruscus]
MDPHEMVVKNPYAQFIIPRAQLRPDLGGQQPEAAPSCSESGPPASGPCVSETLCSLEPGKAKGAEGVKGGAATQGQQTWQPSGNPCGCGQRTGLTYAGRPPVGRGDDIAHHCCCCPCCSCCHCPRFCRCHSCCCVVS